MYTNKIKKAIELGSIYGFTACLTKDAPTRRYIVALTHNEPSVSVEKLNTQAESVGVNYLNVNVGGWTDNKTNKKYIDISTSFNELVVALEVAKEFNQIAIWDNEKQKEIRV